MVSEGLFSLLPNEIVLHILHFLCASWDQPSLNQAMAALRCCSPGLRVATDAVTRAVTFIGITQFRHAIPFISKHNGITEVIIHKSRSLKPSTAVGLKTPSGHFSHDEMRAALRIMNVHWPRTLQRLELYSCGSSCYPHPGRKERFWCLNLPALQVLVLTKVTISGLRLKSCTSLQELHLERNPRLAVCEGLSIPSRLKTIACIHNSSLTALNLSGCVGLQSFKCDGSTQIHGMEDCLSLQHLEIGFNASVRQLDLRLCTSLLEVTSDSNGKLRQLLLPIRSVLKLLSCTNNPGLHSLNLSKQCALQRISCINNPSIADCDISSCVALQTLDFSFNDNLGLLDMSGLTSLVDNICTSNPKLTAVVASCCTALETMECSRNPAMEAVVLTSCGALAKLVCVDNSSLTALDLSDCRGLGFLDKRWCQKLCDVCTQGCPLLAESTNV